MLFYFFFFFSETAYRLLLLFLNILFYNIADLGFTEDVIVVCICLDGLSANQWDGFYYF